MVTLKDGLLFSVNQHAGDPDLKYLCFQINSVQMYHNGEIYCHVHVSLYACQNVVMGIDEEIMKRNRSRQNSEV